MKTQELLNECYQLKEELIQSDEYINLLNSEQEMLADEYVQLLIQSFQTAQSIYNDSMKFSSAISEELGKKFMRAKEILYNHPKVQNYLRNLEKFNLVLDMVGDNLFSIIGGNDNALVSAFRRVKNESIG